MTPTNEAGHGLPELPALPSLECGPHTGHLAIHTEDQIRRYAEDYGRACYALSLSRGVPADMVLVPREPTPEMQRAYFDSIDKHLDAVAKSPFFGRHDNHRVAYRAMIAAAPAAAGAQGDEYQRGYAQGVADTQKSPKYDSTGDTVYTQPAAADGGVRERARELLAQAERGPQNDYGTVHRQIAHAAIEAALTQQHTAAAEHWHDLYRKECRLRQDDAARYGQQIVDLEAALSSHRQAGEPDGKLVGWWNGIMPDVTERSPYGPSVRWGADAENSGHDIPLYDGYNPIHYTAPPLSKFRELAERWRDQANSWPTPTSRPTMIAFAEELLALVEKGAGNGT